MATLLLVRHGQASFGTEDYDELSERGLAQSLRVGEVLRERGERVAALWSGPMRRHRQTAQGLLEGLRADLPIVELPALAEFDHHEVIVRHDPRYEHASFIATLKADPNARALFSTMFREAMARWVGGRFDSEYAESWAAFRQRGESALGTLAQTARADECHVVVTSGGVISVIVQALLGLTTEKALALNWRLANASITRVSVDAKGRPALLTFNEHGHFLGPDPSQQSLLTWR